MRIRMKQTRRGSEDGFSLRTYEVGREYELANTERGRDLGEVFIREGWAEAATAGSKEPPPAATKEPAAKPQPADPIKPAVAGDPVKGEEQRTGDPASSRRK